MKSGHRYSRVSRLASAWTRRRIELGVPRDRLWSVTPYPGESVFPEDGHNECLNSAFGLRVNDTLSTVRASQSSEHPALSVVADGIRSDGSQILFCCHEGGRPSRCLVSRRGRQPTAGQCSWTAHQPGRRVPGEPRSLRRPPDYPRQLKAASQYYATVRSCCERASSGAEPATDALVTRLDDDLTGTRLTAR